MAIGLTWCLFLRQRLPVMAWFCLLSLAGPVVSFAKESNAATSATHSVTLSGIQFGQYWDVSASVRIGMTECATAAWISGTSSVCHAAPGIGDGHATQLTVNTWSGTNTAAFSYDGAPKVRSGLVYVLLLFSFCFPARKRVTRLH